MSYLEQLSQKRYFIRTKKKVYIKFYELFSCFPVFRFSAAFPFTSQRYYQFSRFILQYNKIHHIQSTYQLIINQSTWRKLSKWKLNRRVNKNKEEEKMRLFQFCHADDRLLQQLKELFPCLQLCLVNNNMMRWKITLKLL